MSAPRAPTTAEWNKARAQALRVVKRNYPDVAHEADVIVDDAIAEALPRFARGSFEALVTSIAKRRAVDRLREIAEAKEGHHVLVDDAERAFEATAPDAKPEAPRLDVARWRARVTMAETKEATTAECRKRFAEAIGAGTIIVDSMTPEWAFPILHRAALRARKILALAQETPTLFHLVNADGLEQLAAGLGFTGEPPRGRRLVRYRDASGAAKVYGETFVEGVRPYAHLALSAASARRHCPRDRGRARRATRSDRYRPRHGRHAPNDARVARAEFAPEH